MKSYICRAVALALLAVTAQCQSSPPVLDLNTDTPLLQGAFVDFLEREGSKTRVVQGTNQNISDPDSTVIRLIIVQLLQRPDETTGFERLELDQSALSETVVTLINLNTYSSGTLRITGRFSFDQCLNILRAIDYINNSTNPSNFVVRLIQFQIQDDSGASSQPVRVQLGIVPFNNPPELFLGGAGVTNFTTTFTAGGGCVPVVSESVRLIDPDSDGIEYVELMPESSTWDASFESLSSRSLSFVPPNRYFLNLSRTSDYESLLPEIVYCNTAEEPATGVRKLIIQARDNGSITADGGFLPPSSSQPAFAFVDVISSIATSTADPVSSLVPRPTDGANSSGCAVSNGGCEHLCVGTEGGPRCECRPGYRLVNGVNCLALAGCPAQTNLPLFPGSGITYSWTDTAANDAQRVPCSELRLCQGLADVSGGMVVRRCVGGDSTAEWLPVDFSGCGLSITALRLCEASQQLVSDTAQTAAVLANITASTPELEVTAIAVTTSIVEDLTPAAIDQSEVRGNYLMLIDNVLGATPENILESQRQTNTSARIFQSLERFANEVAIPTNSTNDTLTFALNNFALLLRDVDPRNFLGESFSIDLGAVGEAIQNTDGIDEERLVTMLVPNATASAELPELLFEEDINTLPRQRVTFSVFLTNALFLTPETNCLESAIGSVVLSVGVNSSTTNANLSNGGIRLAFRQYQEPCDEPMPAQSRAMCANFVSEGQYGRWGGDGCRVVSDDGETTHCECAQLGHFGLLFDLNPGEVFAPGAIFLSVVTYVGTAVSILCLLITVVTYSASKKLRSSEHNAGVHGQLLINLSCSLIGLYVFFIVAGHVTTVLPLCGVVAALLQYFMLVFFSWTAVEAVFLYQKLVRNVLGQTSPYFVRTAAAIAWVAPAVIVGVSAGAGHRFYINPFYCRATGYPFWFGLILPVALISIVNWVMFIVIMVYLMKDVRRSKRVTPDKKKRFKKHFLLALGLSLNFGLGWAFGLLATSSGVQELTFAFQIIFSLFVGSQGVLIFLFHVVRASRVRQQWKRWLCCWKRSKSLLVSSPKSPTSPQTSFPLSSLEEPGSLPPTQREDGPMSASNMAMGTSPSSPPQMTSQSFNGSVSRGHSEDLNSVVPSQEG